jgi:hypothetical protein
MPIIKNIGINKLSKRIKKVSISNTLNEIKINTSKISKSKEYSLI